ncbi:hypothetical protein D1007_52533 [Hordeum vulgare]|nr:hypothetical protein D1007_52533 [Hordeum vulgare]
MAPTVKQKPEFFTAFLDHYGIQALHLQPNSILLPSVFAFYYEAFVGVQPSVALLHHFLNLRLHDDAHLSACISFMAAQSDNVLLKAGKKAHSRPVWEYQDGDDVLRLRSRDVPTKDLSRVMAILLGGDPGDLPDALGPLYRCYDRAGLVAVMHVFNERGILPAEGSGPLEVSSGDTSGEGRSEKTVDDCPASVPLPSQSVLLRKLEDDDATGFTPAGTSSRLARASREPVSSTRAMRSACMVSCRKFGDEPPPAHPASAGGRPKAPTSPPSVGTPVTSAVAKAERRKIWRDVEE